MTPCLTGDLDGMLAVPVTRSARFLSDHQAAGTRTKEETSSKSISSSSPAFEKYRLILPTE